MSITLTERRTILSDDEFEFLFNNKDQITFELLQALRSQGNIGKQIALDILDLNKDVEQYYLDAFGNRISFNGNRRLKKAFVKLDIAQIHIDELERCTLDIEYFKDNYVKIKTKVGVNFPDLRPYQNDFIRDLIPDEHEAIIGLMGRQCCAEGMTIHVINNSEEKEYTIEDLFDECREESKSIL